MQCENEVKSEDTLMEVAESVNSLIHSFLENLYGFDWRLAILGVKVITLLTYSCVNTSM